MLTNVLQSILGKVRPFPSTVTVKGELSSRVSISSGVVASPASISNAAQPAACGDDMLVPEAVVVPFPIAEDTTSTPGAKMSVDALLLVKSAATSLLSEAPTEITLLRQAGVVMFTLEPSFP